MDGEERTSADAPQLSSVGAARGRTLVSFGGSPGQRLMAALSTPTAASAPPPRGAAAPALSRLARSAEAGETGTKSAHRAASAAARRTI